MRRENYILDPKGFTLIEVMISLAILGILAAASLSGTRETKASFDRFNARTQLFEDIKLAQAYSASQGCRGIMTLDPDGKGYNFGCDFLGYDTAAVPTPDSVTFQREVPGDISVTASAQIIFNSRGQTVDENFIISNVNFTLTGEIDGASTDFATGMLLGTGIFRYL